LDSFDGGQLLEDATPDRKQLAAWLTDRRHPLTARVIVNRIWQHHFGRGLSTTPSDFGVMGDEPIHVELLDYLADDLMRHGWSLKRLHRMILLSAVYQTRNTRPPQPADAVAWDRSREADPDNLLLSRFPRRRLEAEVIRDSLLATSGLINHEVGGPGIRPNLPREMVATLKSGQWKVTGPKADHYRRSIYIFARRNLRYPFFATFDRPTADLSCARRDQSTTAVQSLLLLNSEITLQAARKLAGKLLSQPGDPIEQAYLTLYGRIPSEAERRIANEFLKEQAALLRSETRKENLILPDGMASSPSDPYVAAAHVDLCRAMYNANEFVYVE
jgi:hypothetical protein